MNAALFAYSRRGCATARRIMAALADWDIQPYTMERFAEDGFAPLGRPAREFYGPIFGGVQAMIFVSSVGLAVREVAPHLKSKATDPAVLVLDEPSAGLDPQGREELLSNIREFHRARGTTVVLVSHSMEEIAKNVDRIVVLSDSHVLMSGTPREVFARGDELMTAGLDVPQVTRVAMALRDKGIAINPAVYTVDELSKELVALKRGGGKKC